jgi:hypothetical protein
MNIHVDHHALWIDPTNPKHLVDGNDGGIYMSWDGGKTWDFQNQIAISQFYAVDVDMRKPYYIYGGVQDYCSWGGPSATRNAIGIQTSDWFKVQTGDGFQVRPDPGDHTIVYAESQNGGLIRHDLKTGRNTSIRPRPRPGQPAYRFNWESPILISPHDAGTIFFGGNFVFKSTNRGDAWTAIVRNSTSGEARSRRSPNRRGRQVALRRHRRWPRLDCGTARPGRTSPQSPRHARQTLRAASSRRGSTRGRRMSPSTVTATTTTRRICSDADYGETWKAIASDLSANGPVRAVREDVKNRNLLFAGTEFGAFVSIDGGARWVRL